MPFDLWLRVKGYAPGLLTPQERAYLRACWEAERQGHASPPRIAQDGRSAPRAGLSLPIRANEAPRPFRTAGPVAIQAAEGEGKLPTFEGVAYTGSPMRPDGWWTPVIIDLAGVQVPSQHRPVLRQHDHEQILGHTTAVEVDDKAGIKVAGTFSGEPQHVQKVTIPARNGFQWQLSVGASPVRTEFLEAGEETEVNGRTVTGPLVISRETEIGEVSFVPLGADGDTSATVTAQKGRGTMNPFRLALKQLMADLRKAGKVKAAKYSDSQIDEMSEDDAKAALKECMKGADDEEGKKADEEEEEADEKTEAGKKSRLAAEVQKAIQGMREQAAGEVQRQSEITARVRQHGVTEVELDGKKVNLAAHAIAAGWSADQAELHALRASRPGPGVGVPGGLGYSTSRPEVSEAVLESAVFQAARHQFVLADDDFYFDTQGDAKYRRVPAHIQRETQGDLRARYTDQVQQAAHSLFRGRIGLQELFVAAGRANGYTGGERIRDDGGIKDLLRAQSWDIRQGIRAEGVSTASIANVLANVLNKFMLQGYLFVEQAWREVSAIRPVNDFKPTKSINLLGDTIFQQVPASGELIDASLGDQAFANQADQYGRILTINRKNIINDDLGILTTAPLKVGQGAGLKLNSVFWTTFLGLATATADDGNTFWNSTGSPATHGTAPSGQVAAGPNYFSGGSSALSSTSLQTAKQLFDRQVDPNGNPLGFDGLTPNILFPPELWQTAIELVDPSAIGLVYGGASASRQPNVNLWKGRLKPVMSRYLSNANFTGYSTTAWYVLFNPVALAVMETCFLNGVDTPTVQTATPDWQFDRLGVSIRGVLDFGCNAQNFRGGVKSAGA